MSSVLDIAKKLNKDYENKNYAILADVVPEYKRLPSGAIGMDYVLFGGLPYGRICIYSGKEHSGKTTAACCELAAYQRANPDKICIYVDVEHSLDLQFQAIMNGVDLTKMLYVNPVGQSGEQILADIVRWEQEADDIGMIILDSIPALVPGKVLDNDFEKDMGKQGTIAKSMHKFCTEITPLLNHKGNILIMINQVRIKDVTFTGAPIYSEPGGDGPKYYASVKVRFGTRTFTLGDNMDACKPDGEGADGFRLKFQITKNKTAPANRGGGFITYRYASGLDYMHDMLEVALAFDYIHRVNNLTYELIDLDTGEVLQDSEGKLLRGKKAMLIDYLNTNDEFRINYMNMLQRHISGSNDNLGNLLSKEESDAIKMEEQSIEGSFNGEYIAGTAEVQRDEEGRVISSVSSEN